MTREEVAFHQGLDSACEVLADWMTERGYATGHGDTMADLLKELEWQIEERTQAYAKPSEVHHRPPCGPGDADQYGDTENSQQNVARPRAHRPALSR